MARLTPIIVTPEEAATAAAHPDWLRDYVDPNVDLWAILDAMAARIHALENPT